MARPTKTGIDYFPFEVGFFEDTKIKRLKARYGTDGICLYIYLVSKIYAAGYYLIVKNEEDFFDDIADTLGIKGSKARLILKYCSERSMFRIYHLDKDKYSLNTPEEIRSAIDYMSPQNVPIQGVNVISSAGIQRRYLEVLKARKKPLYDLEGVFWLLDENESFQKAETGTSYKCTINEGYFEKNPSYSEKNLSKSEINPVKERKDIYTHTLKECESDNEFAKALKEFCEEYGVQIDSYTPSIREIDFVKLHTAYSKSKKFLQGDSGVTKTMSWICKNYKSIIAGKYDDIDFKSKKKTETRKKSGDILKGLFEKYKEDGE